MTANPTKQALESARNRGPALRRHELVAAADQRGPIDDLSATEVIKRLPLLPVWPGSDGARGVRLDRVNGAAEVLTWLAKHPGDGWQDRWLASGADQDSAWMNADTPSHRQQLKLGLNCLLLAQLVRPSYEFLWRYRSSTLFREVRVVFRPDLFATMANKARERGIDQRRTDTAFLVLARMILHTGRDLDQLITDDFLVAREWDLILYGRSRPGAHLAWELLRPIAPLNAPTLHDALRVGQLSSEGLVDKYRLRCRPVRDALVRYLEERRAALDYSSLTSLANVLVGQFWADIERHHPEVDSLKLPNDVVQAWKQRHRVVEHSDGTVRPRAVYLGDLSLVRAFYLDLQEWAEEDPSWLPWATPSPIRKRDLAGMGKAKKQVTAKMHQRVRDRLPHLPILVDTAEQHRTDQAALLAAATATEIGTVFEHNHRTYRRTASAVHLKRNRTIGTARLSILAEDIATGEVIDVTRAEDDAFWAWAALETLRLTGVRVEELVEITHLGLVSYQLPDTGEVVPMLQIVPSKSNEERLLLVSPELASVLATIITRLHRHNDGTVALTARYDPSEKTVGPQLPHLFQRRWGWRWQVISHSTIQSLLCQTLERTGLRGNDGQPLHYTPHDFRRMFASEAVAGGLPVHIVARLLGHKNMNTTQAYLNPRELHQMSENLQVAC